MGLSEPELVTTARLDTPQAEFIAPTLATTRASPSEELVEGDSAHADIDIAQRWQLTDALTSSVIDKLVGECVQERMGKLSSAQSPGSRAAGVESSKDHAALARNLEARSQLADSLTNALLDELVEESIQVVFSQVSGPQHILDRDRLADEVSSLLLADLLDECTICLFAPSGGARLE